MRQCKVFVSGRYAGLLTEHDNPREYTFRYDSAYVSQGGDPVSLTMPVASCEYRSPHLFSFFANLLSEGQNRALQASLLHLDSDDDFGILLGTARFDTTGVVTVEPIV